MEGGVHVTEVHKAKRRIKAVRAVRRSTELEGSRSTDATRADQLAYARGIITAAEAARPRSAPVQRSVTAPRNAVPWHVGTHEENWKGYFVPGTNVLRNRGGARMVDATAGSGE